MPMHTDPIGVDNSVSGLESVFASPNYQAEDVCSSMTVHDGEGRSLISTLCIGVC